MSEQEVFDAVRDWRERRIAHGNRIYAEYRAVTAEFFPEGRFRFPPGNVDHYRHRSETVARLDEAVEHAMALDLMRILADYPVLVAAVWAYPGFVSDELSHLILTDDVLDLDFDDWDRFADNLGWCSEYDGIRARASRLAPLFGYDGDVPKFDRWYPGYDDEPF